jgi:hypothetical protein
MSKIEEIAIFKSNIDVCNTHKERIQMANAILNQKFPFTAEKIEHLDQLELGMCEMLINRFSKLQDMIGEKIFPNVLLLLGEDIYQKTFIDRLNMLEKLGIIDDANQWQNYRNARNAATHEYPDNLGKMAENLNHVMTLSQELVVFWNKLRQLILSRISSE